MNTENEDNTLTISDNTLPIITQKNNNNEDKTNISMEDINKYKIAMNIINNEITAYNYVNIIFIVLLIIIISILINDINCKILNIYYKTKRYNDNIIIKMLII